MGSDQVQEEKFFGFIEKLRDPNADKNLTARERNFYYCLKDELLKIDKEFEKREKEAVKRRKATKTPEQERARQRIMNKR
jgi:hypothetical protein